MGYEWSWPKAYLALYPKASYCQKVKYLKVSNKKKKKAENMYLDVSVTPMESNMTYGSVTDGYW